MLSVAAFALQLKSWRVETETICARKLKILTIWPITRRTNQISLSTSFSGTIYILEEVLQLDKTMHLIPLWNFQRDQAFQPSIPPQTVCPRHGQSWETYVSADVCLSFGHAKNGKDPHYIKATSFPPNNPVISETVFHFHANVNKCLSYLKGFT